MRTTSVIPLTPRKFIVLWLGVSLVLHLLAAVFSVGHQNADEHFQILEFLNAYLGKTPLASLPIEFHQQLRPWFQPFLYLLPVQLLRTLGDENPFDWAFGIRLVSSLIGWVSIVALVRVVPKWFSDLKAQRWAILLLCLSWFLPALHARNSSENLSGALFCLGLAAILEERFLWAGLAWGAAFECRFQSALLIGGALLWVWLVARQPVQKWTRTLCGIGLMILAGSILDRIGYGIWTFAPFNYFRFNLLEGHVNDQNLFPYWDYFRRAWTESWPLLTFLYLWAMVVSWFKRPRDIITWSVVPFFLFHVFIPHKETRFLFPMVELAPICVIMVLTDRAGRWLQFGVLARSLGKSVFALNCLSLLLLSFFPIWISYGVYREVYRRAPHQLYYADRNPYDWGGVPMYFYRPSGLELVQGNPTLGGLLMLPSPDNPVGCSMITTSISTDLKKWDPWNFTRNVTNWTLYSCGN